MDTSKVLHRFDDLSIWKQGDQRARHKPLLVRKRPMNRVWKAG